MTKIKQEKQIPHSDGMKCDFCGRTSNVYYKFGDTDCEITFTLCLPHRNYIIARMYVLIANHHANLKIAEFKKRLEQDGVITA